MAKSEVVTFSALLGVSKNSKIVISLLLNNVKIVFHNQEN
jgi:hypothetical protein